MRQSISVDRWVGFKEMVQKAFGEIDDFKNHEQRTNDEFDKFQDIEKLDANIVPQAKSFFSSYLQDPHLRDIIDKKEFARLNTMPGIDMQAIQELAKYKHNDEISYLQYIPQYVEDYVGNLKEFERV